MSPRPRKASDEAIFGAATRVMGRLGPAQITLADIAAEAGVTASALVQRFGSKRGLLLVLMEQFAQGAGGMFEGLRAAHPSPVETIRAYAGCMAEMGGSPAGLAHHLSWLQQDLTDPDFQRFARQQAQSTREELRGLVEAAVAAGELRKGTNAPALARALEVTIGGSLLSWAFYQEEPAVAWVRDDVEALLAAYVTARAAKAGAAQLRAAQPRAAQPRVAPPRAGSRGGRSTPRATPQATSRRRR